MTKLNFAYLGQSVSTDVEFFNNKGQPFVGTGPAIYSVFSHTNTFITSGNGLQDVNNLARWTATFTIPESAPLPEYGEKYKISWVIKNSEATQTASEFFSIKTEVDPIAVEAGRLVLSGGVFADHIVVDETLTSCSLRLIDVEDNLIHSGVVNINTPVIMNDRYLYSYTSGAAVTNMIQSAGVTPLFAEWSYTKQSGFSELEVHPIYVVSTKMKMFIDGVRRIIDMARNDDINPNLKFTDLDIAHFVLDGIQRINRNVPNITTYVPNNVPMNLYELVKKCAAVEALRARYIAEGMTAFDFQGLSVQLNVDRTSALQSAIDMLNNDLEEQIRKTKKLAIRSSGPGVLGISLSGSTNFPSVLDPKTQIQLIRIRYATQR